VLCSFTNLMDFLLNTNNTFAAMGEGTNGCVVLKLIPQFGYFGNNISHSFSWKMQRNIITIRVS
jgi:hypothetical protein